MSASIDMPSKPSSSSPSPDFTPADRSQSNTSISSAGDEAAAIKPLDLHKLHHKLNTVDAINIDPQSSQEIHLTRRGRDGEEVSTTKNDILLDTYGNAFELPNISINEVRAAIPKHCFIRSARRSLGYVARDFVQLAVNWYLFRYILTPRVNSKLASGVLWTIFTMIQGIIMTGLWVLAHECGHQAFSDSKILNDTVGFVLHSALGVPYFSWKISHGKHHKATGHMERDQVFVPMTREKYASKIGKLVHEITELGEETPIVTTLSLIAQQLMGWNMYLSTNVTGHNKHENAPNGRGIGKQNGFGGGVNHFDPDSPIFDEKDRRLIALSDVGLLMTLTALTYVGMKFGAFVLTVGYIIPYCWVNNWLGKWIGRLIHQTGLTFANSLDHLSSTHRPHPSPL